MKNLSDLRNIEQAVLSYLRLTNDNFKTIKEQLTEDCFIFLTHREIFGLISEQDTNKLFHSDKQLNIFANTMDKYSVVNKDAVINALSQAPSIDIKKDIKTLYQEFLKRKVALRSGAMKKRGSIETKHGLVWFEFVDDRLILVESTDISNLPIELHDNFHDTLHAISSLDLKSDDNELKVTFYGDNKNPEGIESFHLKKNKIELQWLEVLYKWADKNDLDQTVFPRNRYKLQNMTELDLSEQGLTELPKEIGKLDKLDTLVFNNNEIKELPNEIYQLKNLYVLSFIGNQISYISKDIKYLKKLLAFGAGNNRIETLPNDFFKLKELKIICLHSNRLTELSEKIENLSSLKSIRISNNYRIATLPKSIVQLKQLEQLAIENTQISEIPIELLTTTTLNKLSVNDNLLQFLIENINYLDVDMINLSASNFKSSSPILKDLNLKIDTEVYMDEKDKKENGCVLLSKNEKKD